MCFSDLNLKFIILNRWSVEILSGNPPHFLDLLLLLLNCLLFTSLSSPFHVSSCSSEKGYRSHHRLADRLLRSAMFLAYIVVHWNHLQKLTPLQHNMQSENDDFHVGSLPCQPGVHSYSQISCVVLGKTTFSGISTWKTWQKNRSSRVFDDVFSFIHREQFLDPLNFQNEWFLLSIQIRKHP